MDWKIGKRAGEYIHRLLVLYVIFASLAGFAQTRPVLTLKNTLQHFNGKECVPDPEDNSWMRMSVEKRKDGETEERTRIEIYPRYPRLFRASQAEHFQVTMAANNEVSFLMISKNGKSFNDPRVDCAKKNLSVEVLDSDDALLETLLLNLETGSVLRIPVSKKR